MATLNLKSLSTIVRQFAAGAQGASRVVLDFSVGSILRAVAQGMGSVALWLQAEIYKVLLTTRLSTSTGTDVDTFVNDFTVTRLGAASASGFVTFSRFTPQGAITIPVGAQIESADGSQTYTVIADASNPAWNGLNGFSMPNGVATIAVLVKADIPSAASNAQANTLTVLKTTIVGIDTVNNAGVFTGGGDAERDDQLQQRFRLFINSLSKATAGAVGYAVSSLQLGLQYTFTDCENYDGTPRAGFFYVVIDDGTGAPSDATRDKAYLAVDLVRGLGIDFAVFKPRIIPVVVAAAIKVKAGYDTNIVVGQVFQALTVFCNTLPLGQSLFYSRLVQVAVDASPGVENVAAMYSAGGRADVVATPRDVIKTQTLTVVPV